jgi:hypothetical protein
MNKLVQTTIGGFRKLKGLLAVLSLLIVTTLCAQAQTAGAIETAATTMITDAKTAATNVLVAAIGVLAAFVLFKLIKRAVNKA